MAVAEVVIGFWWHDLDTIGTKKRQVADIMIELINRPCIVSICFRAVSKLVPANWIGGRRRDI